MMNSTIRATASRRLVSSRRGFVSAPARRQAQTSQQTVGGSSVGGGSSSNATGYALAGAAGGGAVLLGAYGYYHFSGAKTIVDSAKSMKAGMKSAKDQFVANTKSPNEALQYLRNVSKTYVAIIPGAGKYVDKTFDELDELSESHGEEVSSIVSKAANELKETIDKGAMDLPTAQKVMSILSQRGEELGKLAASAGSGAVQKLLDDHPEVKEKLGGGYAELQKLAEKSGAPDAKKMVEDTTKDLVGIFKNGFSMENINKARDLLKQKKEELKKVADEGSKQAYDKALETAKPYLDKVPEVKKMIEENASLLASSSAGASAASIFSALKDGKLDKSKMIDLVKSKVEEAKKKGSEVAEEGQEKAGGAFGGMQSWIEGAIPEDLKDKIPDLSALAKAASENGDDAQKLAHETYEEILKVLQAKSEEAKKLGQNAKEDAKDASSSGGDDDKSKKDDKKSEKDDKKKKN